MLFIAQSLAMLLRGIPLRLDAIPPTVYPSTTRQVYSS